MEKARKLPPQDEDRPAVIDLLADLTFSQSRTVFLCT